MQDSIESKSELYNKLVEYDDFTEDEENMLPIM